MKISIIVPVYNTEKYLKRCIDSILSQNYADFELLLVDDGSTDGSGALCDSYQQKDSRVRVFHQKNAGVSAARNYGVDQAQGEWVCFVDSDDEVLPDYLSDMIKAADTDECLVIGNICKSRLTGLLMEDVYLDGKEMVRYLLDHSVLQLSGPVAKLFNRTVLMKNDIRFPVGVHYGEDMIHFFRYLNKIHRVVLLKSENYLVNMRDGSRSTSYYSFESEYECFQNCLSEMTAFVGRLDVSPEEQTELVWRNRTSDTFLRCVKCLYAGTSSYNYQERLHLLRGIPKAYFLNFGRYFRPQGFSSKLITFLVRHRLFTLLLLTGSVYEQHGTLKKLIGWRR